MNISNLPQPFIDKLSTFLSPAQVTEVLHALSLRSYPTFRINWLKANREKVLSKLQSFGFELETISWYKDAFILKNKNKTELLETKLGQEGKIYLQ